MVLSDGDPVPPTSGTMQGLIDARISVSTICIQPHGGQDTGVMKKIALDTGAGSGIGRASAIALARAKRAMLGREGTRSPFYWAPFVLVGSAGRLDD